MGQEIPKLDRVGRGAEDGAERTVIIGAGPAGLTAAWELTRNGRGAVVLEQDATHVGGIARTVSYKGFRFDIGGHRFFSKNADIEKLWSETLGDRMIERDRLSRIYYRGRKTSSIRSKRSTSSKTWEWLNPVACMVSYAAARLKPKREIKSFEDWVVNAFGRRLYEIFFRSYTEKVWGIPCSEISADWAAQRIKDLSIGALVKRAFTFRKKSGGPVIKTLIDRFRYPAHGPGEMWETLTKKIEGRGAVVQMGESVVSIKRGPAGVVSVGTTGANGPRSYAGGSFISTMPIRELVCALDPAAPSAVVAAANSLKYRDFITVALIIDQADMFPDNWIYIHEPGVKVGRIQNFKNWSPAMVPDQRYTVLGLEYFCFDSESMWATPDAELIAMGARELAQLGLGDAAKVVDGTVVRQRAAYPVYDSHYREAVEVVRHFMERELKNLQLAGRKGMHKYNYQDHAMMTGLMAAWNIPGGSYDLWRVNGDALYPRSLARPGMRRAGPHGAQPVAEL